MAACLHCCFQGLIRFLLSSVHMLDVLHISSAYLIAYAARLLSQPGWGINDLLTKLISVLTGQSLATLTIVERQSR